ncbi:MAG: hypothetical protein RJA36_3831 [Pseudomonadota bacterium]|jgi:hypothetical protein
MSTDDNTEQIQWQLLPKLPDADTTVLVFIPADNDPVWIGFFDGAEWLNVEGQAFKHPVTAWADFPAGPVSARPVDTACPDAQGPHRSA